MNDRATEIATSLRLVQERIALAEMKAARPPHYVTLIAVTKTYPATDVSMLRGLGIDNFAENRDDEGREKSAVVPATWHFQGQIQSNKIASIAKWADVIHSLDNARHLRLLTSALGEMKKMSIFIQVCLDPQPGRGGVLPDQIAALAQLVLAVPSMKLEGLMAVAPLGENPESAFSRLAQIHSDFREEFPDSPSLSAGMSGDFEVAIAHGATHIRVGSSILGSRTHVR